jgi:predicted nucleotide-binding protein
MLEILVFASVTINDHRFASWSNTLFSGEKHETKSRPSTPGNVGSSARIASKDVVKKKKKILWIDDDLYQVYPYVLRLQDEGIETVAVKTAVEGRSALLAKDIGLVIVDVMFPPDDNELVPTKGGFEAGLVFARWAKTNFPNTPVLGFSHSRDAEVIEWFQRHGSGYVSKFNAEDISPVIAQIKHLVGEGAKRKPRIFIVHGHDEVTKLRLKNYVQNTLKLGEPIILHEMPSRGRTVIEKFEEHATAIDIVFVILTPDDYGGAAATGPLKNRPRQNVVFELGYFLGRVNRTSGRVLLLHKGELELPSDISGVILIDITNGIEAAAECIRRELVDTGWSVVP